jgi:hypothetical protein
LNIDDDVRFTQIFGQARILAEKFLDFLFHGIELTIFTLVFETSRVNSCGMH